MSKEKFTKGEWEAKDNGSYINVHAIDDNGYYLDQVCMGVSYSNKENAPLIANSKAMYEMLLKINEIIGSGLYEIELADAMHDMDDDIKKLLEKARGEL